MAGAEDAEGRLSVAEKCNGSGMVSISASASFPTCNRLAEPAIQANQLFMSELVMESATGAFR